MRKEKLKPRTIKKMKVVVNYDLSPKLIKRQEQKVWDLLQDGWRVYDSYPGIQSQTVCFKKSLPA